MNHQPAATPAAVDTIPDLRKGALTRTGGTLLSFVSNGSDDGEVWRIRDHACIERNLTVYPEDVTGQSARLYV